MERSITWLAGLFVGKPGNILIVALILLCAHGVAHYGLTRSSRSLLVASAAWTVYAAWEWLVQTRTPEANIRVDLMLIWPVLAALTVWSCVRAWR